MMDYLDYVFSEEGLFFNKKLSEKEKAQKKQEKKQEILENIKQNYPNLVKDIFNLIKDFKNMILPELVNISKNWFKNKHNNTIKFIMSDKDEGTWGNPITSENALLNYIVEEQFNTSFIGSEHQSLGICSSLIVDYDNDYEYNNIYEDEQYIKTLVEKLSIKYKNKNISLKLRSDDDYIEFDVFVKKVNK